MKKNGGKQARVGVRFHEAIEEIVDLRLKAGTSKDRVSVEKITNMIIKHKFWKSLSQDLVNAKAEEINHYGK